MELESSDGQLVVIIEVVIMAMLRLVMEKCIGQMVAFTEVCGTKESKVVLAS